MVAVGWVVKLYSLPRVRKMFSTPPTVSNNIVRACGTTCPRDGRAAGDMMLLYCTIPTYYANERVNRSVRAAVGV